MRDGNRLKEKIELRLERRQVVSFVMVAMLFAGALFAVGVLVGKNLASMPGRPAQARNEDLLERLDERAKAGPTARALLDGGPDGLTFQDELTRPEAAASKKPVKGKAPLAAKVDAPDKKPAAALAKVDKPAVPDAGGAAPAEAVAAADEAAPDSDGDQAKPAEEIGHAELPPVAKAPPAKPAAAEEKSPGSSLKSFFTVQVKATQSPDEANRFLSKLKGEGFHAFVAEADIEGKGRWYRVRVGKFETRAKAEAYLSDFKRETHLQAFVTAAGH